MSIKESFTRLLLTSMIGGTIFPVPPWWKTFVPSFRTKAVERSRGSSFTSWWLTSPSELVMTGPKSTHYNRKGDTISPERQRWTRYKVSHIDIEIQHTTSTDATHIFPSPPCHSTLLPPAPSLSGMSGTGTTVSFNLLSDAIVSTD